MERAISITSSPLRPTPAQSQSIPRVISVIVFVIGLTVLFGWQFRIDVLRTPPLQLGVNVAPYTALSFVLLGAALLLSLRNRETSRTIALVCAAIPLLITGIQILEYAGLPDTGFDRFFFAHRLKYWSSSSSVGRMALATACTVFLQSVALFLSLLRRGRMIVLLSAIISATAGVLSLASVLAYAYGGRDLHIIGVPMSLYSAVTLTALCIGVLLSDPRSPVVRLVFSAGAAGIVTRRLLGAGIGTLILLGWMRTLLESKANVGSEISTALMVLAAAVVFSVLILNTAAVVEQSQRKLNESEQRFRAVADNIPEMVWVVDGHGVIEHLSPKWLEFTGTTLEQNMNGRWKNAVHPEDIPVAHQRWEESLRTGKVFEAEYRLRRHDGVFRWQAARAIGIKDASGTTKWYGTTTDVEDQRRTVETLVRSEKLAAAGRLASTVAHEINNPLAAALNALYLAALDDTDRTLARQHVNLAQRELERVAHITKQTLGFYRDTGKPANIDLRKIADSVVELYRPKLTNKNIKVVRRYLTDVPVHVYEGEVRQVIANLVSNSIDAAPNGGLIRLRTAAAMVDGNPVVRLSVADNGSGIEPHNWSRLFEPFFSTKEATGTGLGLWVTKQLVRKQGGTISVRSKPGRGTVFEVTFPVKQSADAASVTEA